MDSEATWMKLNKEKTRWGECYKTIFLQTASEMLSSYRVQDWSRDKI